MPAHNPHGILIGSAVFAQMTAECSYTLQWFVGFPHKIAPSHGWSHLDIAGLKQSLCSLSEPK